LMLELVLSAPAGRRSARAPGIAAPLVRDTSCRERPSRSPGGQIERTKSAERPGCPRPRRRRPWQVAPNADWADDAAKLEERARAVTHALVRTIADLVRR